MTDELELSKGKIRASGPFAVTILVLVALVAILLWQQIQFMESQIAKIDEITWIMSLPNDARACLRLEPPVSMRSRLLGMPVLTEACQHYLNLMK
jgi:hypothetical protein